MVNGAVKRGDNVLVTGVGGGVAIVALQLAVAAGANVYVTSGSEEKIRRAVDLGAKGGVSYKKGTCAPPPYRRSPLISVIAYLSVSFMIWYHLRSTLQNTYVSMPPNHMLHDRPFEVGHPSDRAPAQFSALAVLRII